MNPELVELALRKQRLQLRSADERDALVRHAQAFTPVFRGVDRVVDGVRWARDKAPILSGIGVLPAGRPPPRGAALGAAGLAGLAAAAPRPQPDSLNFTVLP
jgi:hypothetical protein